MAKKYAKRIYFAHLRQLKFVNETDFYENGHQTADGDVNVYAIAHELVAGGFDGYIRPDHGRSIWGEQGKPGYGLFDRALGAAYLNGLFEAIEKEMKKMKNPINTNLKGKVAVVTGAGGIICSMLAKSLAVAGAKVALLDLNEDKAKEYADEIVAEGGVARGYKANVLEKASLAECHAQILKDLGKCDILINGAGGNNPRATTDKEYYEAGDIDADTKSFFDLEQSGVEFVFNLNFYRHVAAYAGVCARHGGQKRMQYNQYLVHERIHAAH